ncbi:serine/threonine-protein kinase [Streptomyces sp. NPDC054863]
MEPLPRSGPARVGPYRLLGKLGAGGMGEVYLARSEGGRTVAVKLVRAELASEPEFRRRFAREVAAARRVGGRWTAAVLDADTDAAEPWVATAYIAGPSLEEVVEEGFGPLPEHSLRVLAHQLAQALDAVHEVGLVHRDLKPSNVLLTVDGPRVIDFGIARRVTRGAGPAPEAALTRTGTVLGSPGFMSPEQVRGRPLSAASDVFSLGAVLVYAATGRLPFGAGAGEEGTVSLMFRVVEDEPNLAGVPEALVPLVRSCLAKTARERPTPAQIAERTAPEPGEGQWLPSVLLAQLGRRSAKLLDIDAPLTASGAGTGPGLTPLDGGPPPAPRSRLRSVVLGLVIGAVILVGGALAYENWPAGGGGTPGADGSESPGGQGKFSFAGAWTGLALAADGTRTGDYVRFELPDPADPDAHATYLGMDGQRLCRGSGALVVSSPRKVSLLGLEIKRDHASLRPGPPRACESAEDHTFTARANGTLEWRAGSRHATLRRSENKARAVPAKYLGRWRTAPAAGTTTTIEMRQGRIGEQLLLVRRSGPGEGCTWASTLVAVATEPDELAFAPPQPVPGRAPTKECPVGPPFELGPGPGGTGLVITPPEGQGKPVNLTKAPQGE